MSAKSYTQKLENPTNAKQKKAFKKGYTKLVRRSKDVVKNKGWF